MSTTTETAPKRPGIRDLPRNVWAVSLTSFFMDVSSEMVINVLPLFLANVLGVRTNIIGHHRRCRRGDGKHPEAVLRLVL